MKRSEAFPSQYVSKDDVMRPVVVTISHVEKVTLKSDNGNEEKPAMYFSDFDKPLLINNINWMTVESVYGDDSDLWQGKRIELYVDPNIMFGNKRVGGVRIRMAQQSKGSAPAGAFRTDPGWTWTETVQKAMDAGITEPELKEKLKAAGLTGYRAERDTPLIKKLIGEAIATNASAPFEDNVFQEEDIPF